MISTPPVSSVWKTVVSETVWELGFEVKMSVAVAKKSSVQRRSKWSMSRIGNSLSNRHSLDPLSGRSYYLSRKNRWMMARLAVQAVEVTARLVVGSLVCETEAYCVLERRHFCR